MGKLEAKLKKDRYPVGLWRHNPEMDRAESGLIEWSLDEFNSFDWDLQKVTPTGTALCEGYDVEIEAKHDAVGTTHIVDTAYKRPSDLGTLPREVPIPANRPQWPIAATGVVRQNIPAHIPVLATLFTPETMLSKITMGGSVDWDPQNPHYRVASAYFESLLTVQVNQLREAGVDAVFLASQVSNRGYMAERGENYYSLRRSERRAQDIVLSAEMDCVYHIHGDQPHLGAFNDAQYGSIITHWHADEAPQSFSSMATYLRHQMSGGVPRNLCEPGTSSETVESQINEILDEAKTLLITPSCTMNTNSSPDLMRLIIDTIRCHE